MKLSDPYSFFLEGSNGNGVLLLHGLTGIPAEMKFIARALNRKGYSVYAPLLAGHGAGINALLETGWQDWLESTRQAALRFAPQVDRLYAAGICVGGKLAMLAAHDMPQTFSATAIYSPCFNYDGWNVPWYYKLAPHGLPMMVKFSWWRHKTYPETESTGIKDARLRQFMAGADAAGVIDEFPALSLIQMHKLGKALKKRLPQMSTPAAILHAREDDLSHPRHAEYIDRHLAAPHELHWIEDSYHMIHVDRQHGRVGDITAEFFKKNARPAS